MHQQTAWVVEKPSQLIECWLFDQLPIITLFVPILRASTGVRATRRGTVHGTMGRPDTGPSGAARYVRGACGGGTFEKIRTIAIAY